MLKVIMARQGWTINTVNTVRRLLVSMMVAWIIGLPSTIWAQSACTTTHQCIPDGIFTISFSVTGDPSACNFTANIQWGDGITQTVSYMVDGFSVSHTYDAAGIYTVQITGFGNPTRDDVTCTFTPATLTIEVPPQNVVSNDVLDVLFNNYDPSRLVELAGDLSNQEISQAAQEARRECSFVRGGHNPFAPGLPDRSSG